MKVQKKTQVKPQRTKQKRAPNGPIKVYAEWDPVPEDVDGLSGGHLGLADLRELVEVVLVYVDGDVLLDAVLHARAESLDRVHVDLVLLDLLAVSLHLLLLGRVNVLGPAALRVVQAAQLRLEALRVYLQGGDKGDWVHRA